MLVSGNFAMLYNVVPESILFCTKSPNLPMVHILFFVYQTFFDRLEDVMKIQVVGSFFLIACLLTGCADSEKLESAPPNALFCKNITENVQTIQHLHLCICLAAKWIHPSMYGKPQLMGFG